MLGFRHCIKLVVLLSPIWLVACGGDDNNDDETRALEAQLDVLEMRLASIEAGNTSLSDAITAIEARLSDYDAGLDDIDEIMALIAELEMAIGRLEGAVEQQFEVALLNVTANQPLAPAAIILHDANYQGWVIGEPASVGLETLAESGSPAALLEEATAAIDAQSSDGVLMPGQSTTVTIAGIWNDELSLTVVAMPVNTNDAFSGATGWGVSDFAVGESVERLLPVYDAGTESNTETSASVPGPAAGGEGFNAERDDLLDQVTMHPGVVTMDGGLEDSALDESHRFDQGLILVRVTRLR